MKNNKLTLTLAALFAAAVLPSESDADVFILNDGAKIEGEIEGKADNSIMVKTKYGNLLLKETDISKIIKNGTIQDDEYIESPEIEVINSKDLEDSSATYVFSTVVAEDGSAKIFYFRNTEIIATETLDKNAKIINVSGKIPDRTFTEYYENNKVKTVKKMKNGNPDGLVVSYYNDGKIQINANYANGLKNGTFTFFSPKGLPMIKANYKDDKLDGPKYEYDMYGKLDKITWYKDDEQTEAPSDAVALKNADATQNTSAESTAESSQAQSVIASATPALPEQPAAKETQNDGNKKQASQRLGQSVISVKARKVARGTIYSFYRNNRYIGKSRLDNDYNVLMTDGKIPDGIARLYGKNDILQIEFIFKKNEITNIIVYDDKGQETAQYSVNEKGVAAKLGI